MGNVVFLKDLVEENGKTVYENNLEKNHIFSIGEKVYYETEQITTLGPKSVKGIFTIFSLDRDCDGTPLYAVISESMNVVKGWEQMCPNADIKGLINRLGGFGYQCGIPQEALLRIPQKSETYTFEEYNNFQKKYKQECKGE